MKKIYEKPQSELFEIWLDGALLQASQRNVETMSSLSGTWDNEEG